MVLKVMYSCNEKYVMQAGISIMSLCESNIEFNKIDIYFVEDNISHYSKKKLLSVIKDYDVSIYFIDIDSICETSFANLSSRHPKTIFSKIYMEKYKEIERLIYLDCDSIVKGSLLELWKLDMKDNIVAGVAMPYSEKLKEKVLMSIEESYICDGFVMIDMKNWRKNNIENKCTKFIEKYNGNPPMLSEGTINYVCKGRIVILPPKYNLMSHMILFNSKQVKKVFNVQKYYSEKELIVARENPVFIHYINELYNRPWNRKSDHPYKNEFLRYKMISPWKEEVTETEKVKMKTKIIKFCFKHLPFGIVNKLYHLYHVVSNK